MNTRKSAITFCSFMVILIFSCVKDKYRFQMTDQTKEYSYLALGDSYTIGESVLVSENFPNQTVQLLKNRRYDFKSPEVVARTGWTTDELQNNINNRTFAPAYEIVTLLIGVNDQYRGRPVD